MDSEAYWQLFLETGDPVVYLLFCAAKNAEETELPKGA
mgnify:CR=1 FL=1